MSMKLHLKRLDISEVRVPVKLPPELNTPEYARTNSSDVFLSSVPQLNDVSTETNLLGELPVDAGWKKGA